MAFFHLRGVEFKIYYWTETCKAGAMVEVVSPSPASLIDLSQRLRALNMTSVEYAIDFMCKSAEDVPLFSLVAQALLPLSWIHRGRQFCWTDIHGN